MSADKKQYYERRKLSVEGVRRAKRIEAVAQRVAVATRRQLSIRTQSIQGFEDSAKSCSHPLLRARYAGSKMHQ